MRFNKPVHFRLQVDQTFFAQTIAVLLVHICSLFFCDRDTETLTLRNVARLTGEPVSAAWAFVCLVIAHISGFTIN